MAHCLPHALHTDADAVAAEAESLVTTTALVAQCASNVFITASVLCIVVGQITGNVSPIKTGSNVL